MLNKKIISTVLTLLRAEYQHTTTALHFSSPFQLLISTILSAQSTDTQVNKITGTLFKQFPDAKAFLTVSVQELEERIKSIGLYRLKAKNILATCRILVERYQGEIPLDREALVLLPGVGRKTANVVLSIATDFAAIAVDTHVFRVANRIGLADAKDVYTTEKQLMHVIPKSDWSKAHHWLIWHGRKVCKARQPACSICSIKRYCTYTIKNLNG
jgi:endonuclease-3